MQQQPPPPPPTNLKKTQITSKPMLLRLSDHFHRIPRVFAVKKPILIYFSKPVIDFLSIVVLDILDDALGFQPPPSICQKIAILVKGAKKLISNFFALKLYISWEARTPKKLEDLLQQC